MFHIACKTTVVNDFFRDSTLLHSTKRYGKKISMVSSDIFNTVFPKASTRRFIATQVIPTSVTLMIYGIGLIVLGHYIFGAHDEHAFLEINRHVLQDLIVGTIVYGIFAALKNYTQENFPQWKLDQLNQAASSDLSESENQTRMYKLGKNLTEKICPQASYRKFFATQFVIPGGLAVGFLKASLSLGHWWFKNFEKEKHPFEEHPSDVNLPIQFVETFSGALGCFVLAIFSFGLYQCIKCLFEKGSEKAKESFNQWKNAELIEIKIEQEFKEAGSSHRDK